MISAAPRNQTFLEGYNGTGSTIGKYLAVRGSSESIALPSAVSTTIYGITAEDIADGTCGNVQTDGVAVALAGEAISQSAVDAGARGYADTDGKIYLWDAATGVNQSIVGQILKAASAEDDLIEVRLGGGGIGQGQ